MSSRSGWLLLVGTEVTFPAVLLLHLRSAQICLVRCKLCTQQRVRGIRCVQTFGDPPVYKTQKKCCPGGSLFHLYPPRRVSWDRVMLGPVWVAERHATMPVAYLLMAFQHCLWGFPLFCSLQEKTEAGRKSWADREVLNSAPFARPCRAVLRPQ